MGEGLYFNQARISRNAII